MRIVFMGTPEFACPTLKALVERGENVVAVVTQPDRPKGRGQQTLPPPVKLLGQQYGIPILQPLKVRQPQVIEELRLLKPDLIVVVAFGQILPKALLEIPPCGCINVHASLLPRYRGAAPLNWCIINGEKETGVTSMMMDVGLDTGDMLLKRSTPIDPDEDTSTLNGRLSLMGAELLVQTIDLLAVGGLAPERQDDLLTCYAPMLKKGDGLIDWGKDAATIKNLVRGMTPWPGAYTHIGDRFLKVFRVQAGPGQGEPGEILSAGRDGIEVACGEGSIVIYELQLEGKKRLTAAEFLAGCKLEPGASLGRKGAAVD
jgi:methionyl-tRNA formyltransferase